MKQQQNAASAEGALITFEGIDGSGKSTQARLLVRHLKDRGRRPLLVREPGGTPVSEQIRRLLLDAEQEIDPMAELLLFSAARAQLAAQSIRPALSDGRIVICDRYYDSTTAYQGGGRRLQDPAWLEDFHRRVTGGLTPDRTYLVELDPETARSRRHDRPDRMEAAQGDFYSKVASAYATLAERHPERIVRLDGTRSIEALHEQITADVDALLARQSGTVVSGSGSCE